MLARTQTVLFVEQLADAPFRRLALLLDLCEDAFCLVVLAMCTGGHLAVTLDLLLSAHIAGLLLVSIIKPIMRTFACTRAILLLFGSPWSLWSSMSSCANMFWGSCDGSNWPLPKMRGGGGFIIGGGPA